MLHLGSFGTQEAMFDQASDTRMIFFLIGHHVVEESLKYCQLLAYGFCKIHFYILLGSQRTPESGRKVKGDLILCFVRDFCCLELNLDYHSYWVIILTKIH